MGGRCDVCDRPLLWGGMDWVEHTPEHHEADRRRLVRYASRLMQERLAVVAGHKVTIRFTADLAWAQCSCPWQGLAWFYDANARSDGHNHLWEVGSVLYWAALRQDVLAGVDFTSKLM